MKEGGRYVIYNCNRSDRALAVRIGLVIHNGRVYPHPASHSRHRHCFAYYKRPESPLIATNLKEGSYMKNLIGIFLLLICLSGCITTASSGSRTEYEDKMLKIEKDYKDMKITKDEYILLKNRASEQGKSARESSGSTSPGESHP
jgi:hypothetical protein